MNNTLRPKVKFLEKNLIEDIIQEAFEVLEKIGVEVENREAIKLLSDSGANINISKNRVHIPQHLVEKSLKSVPSLIEIYNSTGEKSFKLEGDNVYFDPGSAAIKILDFKTQRFRKPLTEDYINFCKVTEEMENIKLQSTAIVPSDVPEEIADRYRLLLSLIYCSKPVVTGTFTVESFKFMKDMLVAVRGNKKNLEQKPLAIFDACPSPPLKWSNLTCQSFIECAKSGIPVELVSMPLAGATSPITLAGTLVQHTAENLSGIVISQLARKGAPIIYGGSPSIFDMKNGTTPMGAIETMMIDCAYAEIGKYLRLPTHSYMGLSDSKSLDSQSGIESGVGIILSALAGINVVSGAGMLSFESCQSIEKLIIDNEICGIALRLIRGIEKKERPFAYNLLSRFEEKKHFLTMPETLREYKNEFLFLSNIIDRGTYEEWVRNGAKTSPQKALEKANEILSKKDFYRLDEFTRRELTKIIETKNFKISQCQP
ncbi:MAG: trimethylamine methyltransferase family protein [Acidobacteriota bacterium]